MKRKINRILSTEARFYVKSGQNVHSQLLVQHTCWKILKTPTAHISGRKIPQLIYAKFLTAKIIMHIYKKRLSSKEMSYEKYFWICLIWRQQSEEIKN